MVWGKRNVCWGRGPRLPPGGTTKVAGLVSGAFNATAGKNLALAGALGPGQGSHQPSAARPPLHWGASQIHQLISHTPHPLPHTHTHQHVPEQCVASNSCRCLSQTGGNTLNSASRKPPSSSHATFRGFCLSWAFPNHSRLNRACPHQHSLLL